MRAAMAMTAVVSLLASCGASSGASDGGGGGGGGGGSDPCAQCQPGQSCVNGACVAGCSAESDAAMCVRLAKNCGSVTALDSCSTTRTVTCGSCASPQTCQPDNVCRCVPQSDSALCNGRNCGALTANDNCGASRTVTCGQCTLPQSCGGAGAPGVCGCTPQCAGKGCGPDGCGGSCGTCVPNSTCSPSQTSCDCNAGYFPSADALSCLPLGQACPGNTPADFCIGGRYWGICDPGWGLQVMDCGVGQCQPNANGVGHGSCTCGSNGTTFYNLGTAGSCIQPTWSNVPYEDWFVCAAGRTYVFNCRAYTGQATGACWTLVSSFGYQSGCYCGQCSAYDSQNRVCTAACSLGGTCSLTGSNGYTCL